MPYTKDKKTDKNNTKVIMQNEIEHRRNGKKKRQTKTFVILAAVAACIVIVIFFVSGGYEKLLDLLGIRRDVSVEPSVTVLDVELKGNTLIAGMGKTLIVYDEHGVTGYSKDGKWKWNENCNLTNPAVSSCGAFIIFADIGGTDVYAFNENGLVWRFGSKEEIKSVFAGGSDCICIMREEDEYLAAVSVYSYDGKTKSLNELFTRKFGSHYMISGAVSEDGRQIALSGIFSSGSESEGIVSFLRVSDGEIFSNVNTDSQIYVKSFYAKDGSVFMVNSDSVSALKSALSVSTEEDEYKQIWSRDNKQEKIIDAVLLNGNLCVIAVGSENSSKSTVKGLSVQGKESFNVEISGNIIGMDSYSDGLLVYTEKSIYLYNNKGLLIGTQEAGFVIENAVCTGNRNIAVCGEGKIIRVSFE